MRARLSPRGSIDRDLLNRGVFVVALEVVWMSWAWRSELGKIHVEVLYAIGASMILMVGVRRLPPVAVLTLALAQLFATEAVAHR